MQTKELSITKKNFWDRNAARYDRFMRKNAIAYDQLYALYMHCFALLCGTKPFWR